MKRYFQKESLPVERVRRYLEPGPIVLVSTAWDGRNNIMTMGWHTVMEFSPSLVGCVIPSGNHSFEMVRKSRECVINLPTTALTNDSLVEKQNFFIREVVMAQVAVSPRHPQTLHYTGDGLFMVSGKIISRRSQFLPEML
jgi:hypothetical protein